MKKQKISKSKAYIIPVLIGLAIFFISLDLDIQVKALNFLNEISSLDEKSLYKSVKIGLILSVFLIFSFSLSLRYQKLKYDYNDLEKLNSQNMSTLNNLEEIIIIADNNICVIDINTAGRSLFRIENNSPLGFKFERFNILQHKNAKKMVRKCFNNLKSSNFTQSNLEIYDKNKE